MVFIAVAKGEDYSLDWRMGYGIVVLIALPPFPFYQRVEPVRPLPPGLQIHFREEPDAKEQWHYHPEEVAFERDNQGHEIWRTCSDTGYVMHVSGLGTTVQEAREKVYRRADNIAIPKMFYRPDIGVQFMDRDRALLTQWGYLQGLPAAK